MNCPNCSDNPFSFRRCQPCTDIQRAREQEQLRQRIEEETQRYQAAYRLDMVFYKVIAQYNLLEQEQIDAAADIYDYCGKNEALFRQELGDEFNLDPTDYEEDDVEVSDEILIVGNKRKRQPEPEPEPEQPSKYQKNDQVPTIPDAHVVEVADAFQEALNRVFYFGSLKEKGKMYRNAKLIVTSPLPPPINDF